MRTVLVQIEGIHSLLQHRFSEQAEVEGQEPTRTALGTRRGTPREEAERVCYRDPEGYLYHPGSAISRLLREAGSNHKTKGSRKSVKYIVPSAVFVNEDAISLLDPVSKEKLTDFEVDSRPVVIPSTKGRIMRHRPRLDRWAMNFTIEVDDEVLPLDFMQQLLTEGGRRLGLGDYRPEKGGPFGRFRVIFWDEITISSNGH